MQRREEQKAAAPIDDYFKRLVAKAILFKQADKIVRAQQFGGYKANIVTYTLSWIFFKSAQRVDLEAIWDLQALSEPMRKTIEQVSHSIFELISSPPGQQNVTEYCKKEACWKAVRDLSFELSYEFRQELLELGGAGHKKNSVEPTARDGGNADDEDRLDRVAKIVAEEWFAIANWAKVTNNLQPWQRSLSFSLGRLASNDRKPSVKQARQGEILREKALELGFVFEEE